MRVAATIAAEDLRRLIRSPLVLVAAVLGPLALGAVLAIAVGGSGTRVELAVVDLDRSEASAALVADLRGGEGPLAVTDLPSEAEARAALEAATVRAVIVVPAGFAAAAADPGAPPPLRVLGDPRAGVTAAVDRSVAEEVVARTTLTRTLVTAVLLAGPEGSAADRVDPGLVAAASDTGLAVGVVVEDRGRAVDGPLYFGPATVFLFFAVGSAARSLLNEERQGTLVRLRAAPVAPWELVAGKAAAAWTQGMVSLVGVWVVSTLAFGANWGPSGRVLVILALVAAAAAGVAVLVVAPARTPQQAEAWNSVVAFTFALVGGSFVPPGSLPPVLATAGLFTPNGLGLVALAEAGAADRPLWAAPGPSLGLMAMALAAGGVGAVVLGRRLSR